MKLEGEKEKSKCIQIFNSDIIHISQFNSYSFECKAIIWCHFSYFLSPLLYYAQSSKRKVKLHEHAEDERSCAFFYFSGLSVIQSRAREKNEFKKKNFFFNYCLLNGFQFVSFIYKHLSVYSLRVGLSRWECKFFLSICTKSFIAFYTMNNNSNKIHEEEKDTWSGFKFLKFFSSVFFFPAHSFKMCLLLLRQAVFWYSLLLSVMFIFFVCFFALLLPFL